ncbi:MAG: DnaA/Hda family protein [Candidatus Paceibacterota bacterium]
MISKFSKRIKTCALCGGKGYTEKLVEGGVYLDDCECVKSIELEAKWYKSGIPVQYWNFDMSALTKEFREKNAGSLGEVNRYVDNLKDNIESGKGLLFSSSAGLGKSSIMSYILRKSTDLGFNAYYLRASHMVSLKFNALRDRDAADLINHVVEDVDILAIEEIEKVYLSDENAMNNQLFYEFLSDLYDSKKSLLVSSNKKPNESFLALPTFIQDRLRNLKKVVFVGKSGRVDIQQ